VINSLGQKLGAPEYAQTSIRQVLVTRMRLAFSEPTFMGRGLGNPNLAIGESLHTRMSPFQAFHVLTTIIDQKFINPEYQVPVSEWDAEFQQRSLDQLRALKELRDSGAGKKAVLRLGSPSKRLEMHQILSSRLLKNL